MRYKSLQQSWHNVRDNVATVAGNKSVTMQSVIRIGTENRTSLDNPVILAVESFKVTSYKFRFSDETMFILPSNDFY